MPKHFSQLLTARQKQVLDLIVEHVRQHGYGPTTRELCKQLGVNSPNAVMGHIRALRKRGLLEDPNGRTKARTLRPAARTGRPCPVCGCTAAEAE